MMKKNCLFQLAPMLLLLASSVKAQPIQVKAARFERKDYQTEAKVVLSGPAFPEMIGYGAWKVLEARDDRGDDLRPVEASDLEENSAIQTVQAQPRNNIIQIGETGRLLLAPPSAGAKRLIRVRGTFSFYAGDNPVVITIPHLKSHLGQTLSAPALGEARIQIALGKFDDQSPNFVELRVSGNGFALQGGSAIEPQPHEFYGGTKLSDLEDSNLIIGTSGDFLSGNLNGVSARRPIDDAMTLRLRVLTRFRQVEVPFELRDVPLPSIHQMKLDDALLEAAHQGEFGDHVNPKVRAQVEALLKRGANVNARDPDDGQTALFPAAHAGDVELVKLLIRRGANPNFIDFQIGSSPLLDVLYFGSSEKREANHQIAMLLLSKGADVNACRRDIGTPLYAVAGNKDLPVLQLLLSKGARVDAQRNDRETPLIRAANKDWDDGVKALLDAGANPNLRRNDNDNEVTALMDATFWVNPKMTEMLLAHGANPNISNKNGETGLLLLAKDSSFNDPAERDNFLPVARMLLAHGANVNARTKKGETALGLATANKNAALVQLLKEAGAKS